MMAARGAYLDSLDVIRALIEPVKP